MAGGSHCAGGSAGGQQPGRLAGQKPGGAMAWQAGKWRPGCSTGGGPVGPWGRSTVGQQNGGLVVLQGRGLVGLQGRGLAGQCPVLAGLWGGDLVGLHGRELVGLQMVVVWVWLPTCSLSVLWHGEAFHRLGVQGSQLSALPCALYQPSVSSASQQGP
jgi:hypothetical protein